MILFLNEKMLLLFHKLFTCLSICFAPRLCLNLGSSKLSLALMVRFLMMELIHPDLNPRFNVGVAYLQLIILSVVDDVPVNSNALFDRLHKSQD
jgi:hypothetical protein